MFIIMYNVVKSVLRLNGDVDALNNQKKNYGWRGSILYENNKYKS